MSCVVTVTVAEVEGELDVFRCFGFRDHLLSSSKRTMIPVLKDRSQVRYNGIFYIVTGLSMFCKTGFHNRKLDSSR